MSAPVFPTLGRSVMPAEVDLTSPVRSNIALPGDGKHPPADQRPVIKCDIHADIRRPRSVNAEDSSSEASRARPHGGRGRDREREGLFAPQEELGAGRMRSVGGYDRQVSSIPLHSRLLSGIALTWDRIDAAATFSFPPKKH